MASARIQELFRELMPDADARCPSWPPDVYGLTAALLQRSGAYRYVVEDSKPSGVRDQKLDAAAAEWRAVAASKTAPSAAEREWSVLWHDRSVDPFAQPRVRQALLRLLRLADQASTNAGIPLDAQAKADWFDRTASRLLLGQPATLGTRLDARRLRVLPKLHTPQNGLTIRSLSHNLSFYRPGERCRSWRCRQRRSTAFGRRFFSRSLF